VCLVIVLCFVVMFGLNACQQAKKWRLIGMQAYVNCSVGQSRGRLVMSTAKNEFAINAVSRGLRVSLSSAIYTFA
jgi:hypothetical protein